MLLSTTSNLLLDLTFAALWLLLVAVALGSLWWLSHGRPPLLALLAALCVRLSAPYAVFVSLVGRLRPPAPTSQLSAILARHEQKRAARLHGESGPQAPANLKHAESLSLNERIANVVSDHVGTMWFCYGLALLMLAWSGAQLFVLPALGIISFDPFPFPFLFFCLGGIMQSLLMPLIMVAQNLQGRHAELRAEADHETTQRSFGLLEQQNQVILASEQELLKQTPMIASAQDDLAAISHKLDALLTIISPHTGTVATPPVPTPRARRTTSSSAKPAPAQSAATD